MDSLLLSPGTSAGGASRGPSPARLTGSALVRLLAGLAGVDAPESAEGFTERLSRWLEWTDAISLASALNTAPATTSTPTAAATTSGARAAATADEREVARVRTALVKLITDERPATTATTADARRSNPPVAARRAPRDDSDDFPTFRRLHLARQQSMEAAIAPLRQRLRATLSATSPALAQLAALDAVMERVLGARERALLGVVPHWLERRFEHLRRGHLDRQAAPAAPAAAPARADAAMSDAAPTRPPPARLAPPAWLDVFRRDQQAVLLAELELRMQPVDGLLAALRPPEADTPTP